MARCFGFALLGVSSALLMSCVEAPGRYSYAGYNPSPAPAPAPSPAAPPTQVAALVGPAGAPVAEPASGPVALPPLNLPIRENWSSAKCPELAVTFSGRSQPARSTLSDTASFQEARQMRDGEYYEVAECFCAKSGDLSETTRAAADAVMAETAQQFAESSHMRVRRTGFIEASPLGKYSELEAAAVPPSNDLVTLRTYWRGQCSMRLATMSSPITEIRAAQFLNSLREVKATSDAAPTVTPPDAAASVPPPPAALSSTSPDDFAAKVKQRAAELNAGPAASADPAAAAHGAAVTASSDGASPPAATDASVPPDVAERLRQLQELSDRGLITKEEYADKRRAILSGL